MSRAKPSGFLVVKAIALGDVGEPDGNGGVIMHTESSPETEKNRPE